MKAFKSGDAIIQFEIKPIKSLGKPIGKLGIHGKIFRISDGKQMYTSMTLSSGIPTVKPDFTVTDEEACAIMVRGLGRSAVGLVEMSGDKLVLEPCKPVKQATILVEI